MAKAVNYFLLAIYLISFSVDLSFAIRACYDASRAVSVEGIVDKVEVREYRATTKIPRLQITMTRANASKF